MYATLVSVTIEQGHEDEAHKVLVEQVLPRVKDSPGFVAGYWLDAPNGQGSSIVIWKTKKDAEATVAMLPPGAHPAPSVTVVSVEVREVIESI